MLELLKKLRKIVKFKITQKSVTFLYTHNEQFKKEIKNATASKIA